MKMGKVSFEDIGGVVATFAAQEGMSQEAQMVKITDDGEVGPCGSGDNFCGLALAGADGTVAVQVKGFIEVAAPSSIGLGWVKLSANGTGGVKVVDDGKEYLVVSRDSAAGTAVICL